MDDKTWLCPICGNIGIHTTSNVMELKTGIIGDNRGCMYSTDYEDAGQYIYITETKTGNVYKALPKNHPLILGYPLVFKIIKKTEAEIIGIFDMNDNTWLCPICGIENMPYGRTCQAPESCGNKPNHTGSWYIDDKTGKRKTDLIEGDSIGIAEIANAGEDE